MDPCAPSITFYDKETGKGRTTYLGSLTPEHLFYPTPGLWFTNQGQELIDILVEHFTKDAYPSKERMEELAAELGAPDYKKIESFYVNMRLKHQETFQ